MQRQLSMRILIGLVIGATCGILAQLGVSDSPMLTWLIDNVARPGGQIFLRLLFMLVLPIVFCALVIGIAELDLRRLGRMGLHTLVYTFVFSSIAVAIGLLLVNILQPGAGLPDGMRAIAATTLNVTPPPPDATGVALLVSMFPDNPIKAAANGDMLGVILFAIIFGVGLAHTRTHATAQLHSTLTGIYEVSLTLINGVLKLAPIGVGLLMFTLTAQLGWQVLAQLLAYVGVVLLGLALQMFGVYSLSLHFLGRRNPVTFFRDVRVAMITAFATASSSATLPTALAVAETNLRLPPYVARFVLTAGSAMNQHGTALFEGVTVLFLAQVFGVELELSDQLLIMAICILGGIGTAGVPAGSLPVIAMILVMFDIPVEGLGLILGVDRILDMCRTTLNVTGDLVAAVYIARLENTTPTKP